ncbi:glucosidase II, partial [Friedmanniomyces endolithicus]
MMLQLNGSSSRWTAFFLLFLALCSLLTPAVTVKHENFKICDQSGFCKRNRAYADTALSTSSWSSPYTLEASSVRFDKGLLTGVVTKEVGDETIRLPLTVSFYESGTARVTIDEEKRRRGEIELRHNSKARKERYNEAEQWAIVGGTVLSKGAATTQGAEKGTTRVAYGPAGAFEAVIKHSPFGVDFKRNGETQIKFNGEGMLNVEHWRPKIDKPVLEKKEGEEEKKDGEEAAEAETNAVTTEDEGTWWEESFGGNTDSKPRGPEAVALDISFPGYQHVYGLAEHTGPLSLKETRGGDGKYSEPYRMYNSDVFEYEMDSPMTLYGSIPFMQAQKKNSTVGVLWLNAAETWVDITRSSSSANPLSFGIGGTTTTNTHWISESGLLDVFVMLGPKPQDVIGAYSELTGYTQLPQQFAIAYHQCRWNYVTDEDVKDVDRKFDKNKIPYDVIWLDIEYTEGKKYFTWDPMTFADPLGMQKQLDEHERKLVAIIDPHIKNEGNYYVVDELKSKDLAVHNKDDNIYEG